MISPVAHVGEMASYELAALQDLEAISLAQNESAFPMSPAAVTAGRSALEQSTLYPDPDWSSLRQSIANNHKLDPSGILCGAGSMELIGCIIRAYAGPGDTVVGTEYGYAFVATAANQACAIHIKAKEGNLTVSVDEILSTIDKTTKIVFVCNPGNPTGTLIPNEDILRLRSTMPDNVLLVIDQAYAEFADHHQHPQEVFQLAARGDTVVLRTFSKAYGLAGTRVGWGYFPSNILLEARKLLNPNNVSITSQAMATAAMDDQEHMASVVTKTTTIRDKFTHAIRNLGVHVPTSHTNFALLQFDSPQTAQRIDEALKRNKLILRSMGGYGLSNCLRATICKQPTMDRVVAVIKGELQ